MRPSNIRLAVASAVIGGLLLSACGQGSAGSPFEHVDAEGAVELLAREGETTILDIRTPAEFEAGHLAGAVNIDYKAADFEERLEELSKDRTYLLHCQSGVRSKRSLALFEEAGFTRVVHLDGGLRAWKAADQPVQE